MDQDVCFNGVQELAPFEPLPEIAPVINTDYVQSITLNGPVPYFKVINSIITYYENNELNRMDAQYIYFSPLSFQPSLAAPNQSNLAVNFHDCR